MKYFLSALGCFIFSFQLIAQVQFKVTLNSDNIYEVYLKASKDYNSFESRTTNGQITLTALSGSFDIDEIKNIKGSWDLIQSFRSPEENKNYDYFVFSLLGQLGGSGFPKEEEILLFTFINNKECTAPIEIIDNTTDPFAQNNSSFVNVGNSISIFGAGPVNAYSGNYDVGVANCSAATSVSLESIVENQGITSKIIQWTSIEGAVSYTIKVRLENQTEWLNSLLSTAEKIYGYFRKDKNFEYQIDVLLEDGNVKNSPIYSIKN